jgi:hypothetical protein
MDSSLLRETERNGKSERDRQGEVKTNQKDDNSLEMLFSLYHQTRKEKMGF